MMMTWTTENLHRHWAQHHSTVCSGAAVSSVSCWNMNARNRMFPVDIGSVRPRVGGFYCCPGVEVLPTRPGCTGRLRLRRVFLPGARTRVSGHLESVTAVKLHSSAGVFLQRSIVIRYRSLEVSETVCFWTLKNYLNNEKDASFLGY